MINSKNKALNDLKEFVSRGNRNFFMKIFFGGNNLSSAEQKIANGLIKDLQTEDKSSHDDRYHKYISVDMEQYIDTKELNSLIDKYNEQAKNDKKINGIDNQYFIKVSNVRLTHVEVKNEVNNEVNNKGLFSFFSNWFSCRKTSSATLINNRNESVSKENLVNDKNNGKEDKPHWKKVNTNSTRLSTVSEVLFSKNDNENDKHSPDVKRVLNRPPRFSPVG